MQQKKVKFRPRQEQTATDHNNVQAFNQEGGDHLVRDAISTARKFAGADVTSLDTTNIRVSPGRLYDNGAMYASDQNSDHNLFDHLPLAAKRIVTVVAAAQTADVDTQVRQFLINVETRATQPQAVPMREERVMQLGVISGVESADPQRPPIAAQYLAIADVVLGTTGILEIRMIASNRIPRLVDVDGRVKVLEAFKDVAEPRFQTLASDISSLAEGQRGTASTRAIIEMASDIARIKDIVGLEDDYASYGADYYLTEGESDTANLDYLAKVMEGIRFPADGAADTQISVFNPLDPAQMVSGGILLPAFTSVPRIQVTDYAGELRLSQYQFQTNTLVQKTMSRQRIRYGQEFSVCTNNRAWWVQGNYDPVSNTFSKAGETFQILNPEALRGAHEWVRVQQMWTDTFEEAYWDVLTTTTSINGQLIGQTFLNSQDGWCTGVRVGLTRLAGSGSIHLALCETFRGEPDLDNVIARVEVQRGSLKTYPGEGATLFPLPPTYLQAGKRYAVVIITAADHYAATATGGNYAQGTLFYSADGAFLEGDFTRDLVFSVEFARFERPRTVVALAGLSLSGGIAGLDILAPMVVPNSCQCFFEIQAAGGGWETVDQITASKLVGLPPLLQFRAVFIGTTDVAPGIQISGSRVRLTRPKTNYKHISKARTLAAPSSQIKVKVRLENWNPARHTHAVRLLCGSPGFATIETADVTDTQPTEDPKAIIREYTFNTGAPVSAFKIEQSGTTTTALDTYLVSYMGWTSF